MQKNLTISSRRRTHRSIIDRMMASICYRHFSRYFFNVFEDLGCWKAGRNISRVRMEQKLVGLGYLFRPKKQRRTARVKEAIDQSSCLKHIRSIYSSGPIPRSALLERERRGFSGAYFCSSQMSWQVSSTPVIRSYVWVDSRRRLR